MIDAWTQAGRREVIARPGAFPLADLTTSLEDAAAHADVGTMEKIYQMSFGGALNPRILARATGPSRVAARRWFETWNDALQLLAFSPGSNDNFVRALLFPQRGGFRMGLLLLNAFWLHRSGSDCVERPVALPSNFESLPLNEQARALGAILVRSHGRCPIDYASIAEQLPPSLLPALLLWFLGGYLVNPLATIDPVLAENRERAIEGFVRAHRDRDVTLPPLTIFGVASFSGTGFTRDPRAFLETLSERLLAPTLARARRKPKGQKKWRKLKRGRRDGGLGLILTGWKEDSAVYRCMNPVVNAMKSERVCGIQLGSSSDSDASVLPATWRNTPLRSVAATTGPELARAADQIRALHLDFLMYPEVGLGNTRWLATQRLARVQATGYGHPVTTGSKAIDYFVGGVDIELDARHYRERLVLLPGLGVSSEVPPPPSGPRTRQVGGQDVVMVTLASYNKLNQPLLQTWNSILRDAGPGARLQMAAGLSVGDSQALVDDLAPHLKGGAAELKSMMPRQECIDLLAEADFYLDSFPFNGYNTVVEALVSGCPVVTLEGRLAYSRFAAATLRLLGLPEWMIAKTPAEYVAAALRLIREPSLRSDLRAALTRERILPLLCNTDMAPHFNAAVEWMREQGPQNPGPPVLIQAGEAPRALAL